MKEKIEASTFTSVDNFPDKQTHTHTHKKKHSRRRKRERKLKTYRSDEYR